MIHAYLLLAAVTFARACRRWYSASLMAYPQPVPCAGVRSSEAFTKLPRRWCISGVYQELDLPPLWVVEASLLPHEVSSLRCGTSRGPQPPAPPGKRDSFLLVRA